MIPIIGLSGKARSGKDTAAQILVNDYGFVKIAFADPLKRILMDLFDFSYDNLWGPSENRSIEDSRYIIGYNEFKEKQCLSPRIALQSLGAWSRGCYQDIWAKYTANLCVKIKESPNKYWYKDYTGLVERSFFGKIKSPYKGIVISDCRFRNEMESLKFVGADLFRIKREGAGLAGNEGKDKSETEQDGIQDSEFNGIIDNNSDIKKLKKQIHNIVEDAIKWA